MRFAQRFQNGSRGTLAISVNPETGAPCPVFTWYGRPPPLRGEHLNWIKRSYENWSNTFGRESTFVARFRNGAFELWRCLPGKAAECVSEAKSDPPLADAVKFATAMLAAARHRRDRIHPDPWTQLRNCP